MALAMDRGGSRQGVLDRGVRFRREAAASGHGCTVRNGDAAVSDAGAC
jgi:hypothetical protein